jgi:hypothetical protein
MPHAREGVAGLGDQTRVLTVLHSMAALGEWRCLLPVVMAEGTIDDQPYVVERMLPGASLPPRPDWVALDAALDCIRLLHERTAHHVVVDQEMLECWVEQPAHLLRQIAPRLESPIDHLARWLRSMLVGRRLRVGWIHGDFWSRNLLAAPDGLTITGLVDWDLAEPDGLATHDALNLVLSAAPHARGTELGGVIRDRLQSRGWLPDERQLLENAHLPLWGDHLSERAALCLYWLRYVSRYLAKCPDRGRDGWWMDRNVATVLEAL